MAEGFNRVMLLGNLGADPDLRFTQGGSAVLNLRVATTESYLDKDKVRRDRTDWHSVVVWGKRGESLAKILSKGSSIFVEGALRTSSYDDRDGNKKYKTEIHATNIVLAGGRRGGGDGGEPQGDHDNSAPRDGGGGGRGGYENRGGDGGGGRGRGGTTSGGGQRPAPQAHPTQGSYPDDFASTYDDPDQIPF